MSAGYLWNGMVNSIKRNPVKGFLWYQGEANGGQWQIIQAFKFHFALKISLQGQKQLGLYYIASEKKTVINFVFIHSDNLIKPMLLITLIFSQILLIFKLKVHYSLTQCTDNLYNTILLINLWFWKLKLDVVILYIIKLIFEIFCMICNIGEYRL